MNDTAAPAPTPAEELPGLIRRGVGWTMFSQGSVQGLALLTSIVVARLLSPRSVGLASEATVFVSLALVVADFGFAAVIVQRPTISEEDKSTLFWVGIGLGLLLTAIGVGASGLIADLYGEPRVQKLFAVMSLTFVTTAPGIVQGALLMREMKFRSLELRTVASMTVSAATAITLAALGAGPWAIVAQTITMSSVSTALLWRSSSWRPRMVFSMESLRDAAGFGSHILGSRMVGWANSNLDNLLVGRFRGSSPLGAYSLAYAVALTPVTRIGIPITTVLFPAFSRVRDREQIFLMWLRALRVVAFFVVPAVFGLVVVAPDLVRVVFGFKWRHAAPVMQVLALVGLTQTLTSLNDGVLQSLDRTRIVFRFRTVLSVVTLLAFAAGLPWGITGASLGYLIASLILQPLYVWITVRAVGMPLRKWLGSVALVFELAAIMMGTVYVARRLLVVDHAPPGLRLPVLIVIGALVYGGLALWQRSEVGVDVLAFRRYRPSRRS